MRCASGPANQPPITGAVGISQLSGKRYPQEVDTDSFVRVNSPIRQFAYGTTGYAKATVADSQQLRNGSAYPYVGSSSTGRRSPQRTARPSSAPMRSRWTRADLESQMFRLSELAQKHRWEADACWQERRQIQTLLEPPAVCDEFQLCGRDGVYMTWLREMEAQECARERQQYWMQQRVDREMDL